MVKDITREQAEVLVKAGFLTVEGILAAEEKDLAEMTGFDAETARSIHNAAAATIPEEETPA
jgi:transcription termination factor NusA